MERVFCIGVFGVDVVEGISEADSVGRDEILLGGRDLESFRNGGHSRKIKRGLMFFYLILVLLFVRSCELFGS